MKQKVTNRDKYFWKNLGRAFLIYIVAGVLITLGLNVNTPPNTPLNWSGGFGFVSVIATIILIFKVTMDFTNTAYPKRDR